MGFVHRDEHPGAVRPQAKKKKDRMKDIDATLQYLHWALIAAHRAADQDAKEVHVDLVRNTTSTTTVKKDKAAPCSDTVVRPIPMRERGGGARG